jgi:hypothetical protein
LSARVTRRSAKRARRAARGLLVFSLWLCTSGCSKQQAVSLREGPRSYDAGDYKPVLEMWTRKTELISQEEMDNVLSVTATFESWDFRFAYVERYARDYRLSDAKKAAFQKRSLEESQKYHQFYVALYAQEGKWADLDAEEPTWIVRLVDSSGKETDPIKMDKVRRPTARELTYFPYTNSFRTVYRLSFPRLAASGAPTIAPDAEWFALRFAGAQGQADVTWNLD